jgi:diguanylate cyclase (GGDEF)-like protein
MAEQSPGTRPLILVVDDSRLMRVAARKILKEHFEIVEAGDGEAAWRLIEDGAELALVMSDLSMPHLDGLGLLDKIRSSGNPRIRELPVVIVTGAEDDSAAREQALERGANDFITKPFESVQLVARARAQVKLRQTSQELGEKTEALEKQSGLDGLTGLLNQRAFLDHGQQDLAYAVRHQSALSLVRLEPRDFNKVFLRQGKAAAEQILRDMASILKGHLRREDSAARLGMAQFGLLLPGGNAAGVRALMERIAAQITELNHALGPVTFNAGIACLEHLAQPDWEALLDMAEQHLLQARQTDGNVVAGLVDGTRVAMDEPGATGSFKLPSFVPETAEISTEPLPQTATPAPAPSLEAALAMIGSDRESALIPHLDGLVGQVLPLLELWDRQHDSPLSVCLHTLRHKLEQR